MMKSSRAGSPSVVQIPSSNVCLQEVDYRVAVFYPDTLGLRGNSQHWGEGVGGLCPQRGPGAEPLVWGQSPQKLEAFCCISSLFLSILELIVELWLLYVYAIITCSYSS